MFDEDDLIYAYTRAEALEDGVLVDVTETAKELGFRWPVAVTSAVWGVIEDIPEGSWQGVEGRLWDILFMAAVYIKKAPGGGSTLRYLVQIHHKNNKVVRLKLVCGPGDTAEPVVTIMMPDED
jgi:hypothetical protein